MSYCGICQRSGHRASSCPRRPGLGRLIVIAAVCLLPGCSTLGSATQAVGIDTFCLQRKRMWSVNDNPESIRDARVFNETIDRRCGVAGKAS